MQHSSFLPGSFLPFPFSFYMLFQLLSDFWSELFKCYNYQVSLDFPAIQAWERQITHLKVTGLGVKELSQQSRYPFGKQRSSIPHVHEDPAAQSTSLSTQRHYLTWALNNTKKYSSSSNIEQAVMMLSLWQNVQILVQMDSICEGNEQDERGPLWSALCSSHCSWGHTALCQWGTAVPILAHPFPLTCRLSCLSSCKSGNGLSCRHCAPL